jgi:hypothetical protein
LGEPIDGCKSLKKDKCEAHQKSAAHVRSVAFNKLTIPKINKTENIDQNDQITNTNNKNNKFFH